MTTALPLSELAEIASSASPLEQIIPPNRAEAITQGIYRNDAPPGDVAVSYRLLEMTASAVGAHRESSSEYWRVRHAPPGYDKERWRRATGISLISSGVSISNAMSAATAIAVSIGKAA